MKLSKAEIQELIGRYQSELRKLTYQSDNIKSTIQELETHIAEDTSKTKSKGRTATTRKSSAAKSTTTRRRGRPPKAKTAAAESTAKSTDDSAKTSAPATPKRRRGRPAKAKTTTPTAPKRRGRPPKAKTAAAKSSTTKSTAKPAAKSTAKSKAKPAAKSTAKSQAKPATAKRRGRPSKAKSATAKRRGRPPKAKTTAKTAAKSTAAKSTAKTTRSAKPKSGGYRLSEWDNLVLDTLKSKAKVLVFADFLAEAKAKQGSGKNALTDKDLYRRINQSLHKLANKRGAIIKVSHQGRGFAYGLPEWKSGRGVKQQYR